jgi:carbon-monoxide dehydrogenase small subunit
MMSVAVRLEVNGEQTELIVEDRMSLADALRDVCHLTGTHLGCEQGVCGACTVLVDEEPVRSCLVLARQAEDRRIRTIEGLADDERLHPLQAAFIDNHGVQCGFCTPGFIMLIVGYLSLHPDATDAELREVLSSNICRCTGYRGILAAAREYQVTLRQSQC